MPFTPGEHDVRVVRQGCVYWVRVVKRGQPLRWDLSWDGSIGGFVAFLLVGWLLERWWASRSDWTVGVLCHRDSFWGRLRVVHKELVPAGKNPVERVNDIAVAIEAGRFSPC